MYKLHLIFKYLRKRRIAWWSLFAVALCTTMVLVVISVMGGWLQMARGMFRGLRGDVLIEGDPFFGFGNYPAIIDKVMQVPGVQAAVPVIHTFGLVNINDRKSDAVTVIGLPIDQIGKVNSFPESLYRQTQQWKDATTRATDPDLTAAEREDAARDAAAHHPPPSFGLIRGTVSTTNADLPPETDLLKGIVEGISYDAANKELTFRGRMTAEMRDALKNVSRSQGFTDWLSSQAQAGKLTAAQAAALSGLSSLPAWRTAIANLYPTAIEDGIDYSTLIPGNPAAANRPGIIAGTGVLNIRKDENGKFIGRGDFLYKIPVTLTVLRLAPGEIDIGQKNKSENRYWIVDDSRTGVWQYDSNTVYVAFDGLQSDLGMDEQTYTLKDGRTVTDPARCSEIDIKLVPGTNLDDARARIEAAVNQVWPVGGGLPVHGGAAGGFSLPNVETWEQSQALWLGAIDHEKLLVTFLFGIISIVAIFLIFCIFYMIVMEKTRDIGIIKSIGATSQGIASIFLGYGLVIGIIGGGLGLLAAYGIVHNINFLHEQLAAQLGVRIWDPQVYVFDTIPNTMNPREVTVIVAIAVISAVAGATLPALRAARMNPVEAIRWE